MYFQQLPIKAAPANGSLTLARGMVTYLPLLWNMLVINVLHTSAVGAGFIPVLPTTDKILNKFPAAARTGKIVAYS
mgnify:CR=1 FL=1